MSENIVQVNEEAIKRELKDLVRESVEETLNAFLDKKAYERIEQWRSRRQAGKLQAHMERLNLDLEETQ